MFCLFARFLPVVATAEVKGVLPRRIRISARKATLAQAWTAEPSAGGSTLMSLLVPALPAGRDFGLLAEFGSPKDALPRLRAGP